MKKAMVFRTIDRTIYVGSKTMEWMINEDGFIAENPAPPAQHWKVRRTVYKPMKRLSEDLLDRYSNIIFSIADFIGIPAATLVATAANESAGDAIAERREAHINDYSFGLCQQVTGTAYTVGRLYGWTRADRVVDETEPYYEWLMPMMSIPAAKKRLPLQDQLAIHNHWRAFLSNPWVSFMFAAFVFDAQAKRWKTEHDPILDYATYNSGGLYEGNSRYGLHATRSALEAFVLFYNDATAIL